MKIKKFLLSIALLLPFSIAVANKNIIDEGKPVNEIVVSGFTIKVSENSTYVYIFVHKDNHTVLATKFNK
jgi:hypothetical protein